MGGQGALALNDVTLRIKALAEASAAGALYRTARAGALDAPCCESSSVPAVGPASNPRIGVASMATIVAAATRPTVRRRGQRRCAAAGATNGRICDSPSATFATMRSRSLEDIG